MARSRTKTLFPLEPEEPHLPYSHTARVVFESAADIEFDYAVPHPLWPVGIGQRIQVPFGKANRLHTAFCVGVDLEPESSAGHAKTFKLKFVNSVVDKEPLLDNQLIELARWISGYYVCPLGQVLAAVVPAAVKKGAGVKTQKYVYLIETNEERLATVRGKKQKDILQLLQAREAFDRQSAVELSELTAAAACTKEPVKRLVEQRIAKIAQRKIVTALPAIPEAISEESQPITLNEDQQRALGDIGRRIESARFGVTLIHGVTDSGKTELYIRAIQQVLDRGQSAIVLLPEIALTTQTIQRFNARFDNIAVMHSGLTAAQRNVQWQNIKAGQANVIIGARSAVFAPVDNLGLIVVDEEHEPSYKQDTAPRYNGRDVAIKRAHLADAQCILGSATPSLETLRNCENRAHFHMVRLPRRVMDLPMPKMDLIDMRTCVGSGGGLDLISPPLAKRLSEVLARGEQAILLLNRRGYSNFVYCPSCKHTLQCRNCDVTLTFHRARVAKPKTMYTVTGSHMRRGYAICHYCLAQTLVPENCPVCRSRMTMIGLGSQRLEEEVAHKFPAARITRVDSDSMAGKDYYRVLRDFGQGRIDILAGTQMLAKGLHFPDVTLVGIISADTALYLPDFRANERTFQLISQVAGRTGRSEKGGTVFIQTFLPSQPAIQFALNHDFARFVEAELQHRRSCNLPPYWRFAIITLRDTIFEKLEQACNAMRDRVNAIIGRDGLEIVVRGPMPATISRVQRFHRMQIIVQAPNSGTMHALFSQLRHQPALKPAVKVAIDIDPVNLL